MDGELPPSLDSPFARSSGLVHGDLVHWILKGDSFFYSFRCSFFFKFAADTKGEMEDWIAFIRSVWDDVEQPSLEV